MGYVDKLFEQKCINVSKNILVQGKVSSWQNDLSYN